MSGEKKVKKAEINEISTTNVKIIQKLRSGISLAERI